MPGGTTIVCRLWTPPLPPRWSRAAARDEQRAAEPPTPIAVEPRSCEGRAASSGTANAAIAEFERRPATPLDSQPVTAQAPELATAGLDGAISPRLAEPPELATAGLAGARSSRFAVPAEIEQDASAIVDAALTEPQRAILDFERQWWRQPGAKEQAIRETFGMTPTRYYQNLNTLLDLPAAVSYDASLVHRLQRVRTAATRGRRLA